MKSVAILELSLIAMLGLGCATTHTSDRKVAATSEAEEAEALGVSSTPENRIGEYPDPATIHDMDWLGIVPDAALTPGKIDPCIHAKDLCTTTTSGRRDTTEDQKKEVLASYENKFNGYTSLLDEDKVHAQPKEGDHEIDHLISLEIAGADVNQNLWPQPFQSRIAGAADKDQVEHHSKPEMCAILKAQGAPAADSYLAMMQRVISGGFGVSGEQIVAPRVSWYDLYYADVLPNTDHHNKLKKGAKVSFAPTFEKYKTEIMAMPAPQEEPSKANCKAPQIIK